MARASTGGIASSVVVVWALIRDTQNGLNHQGVKQSTDSGGLGPGFRITPVYFTPVLREPQEHAERDETQRCEAKNRLWRIGQSTFTPVCGLPP